MFYVKEHFGESNVAEIEITGENTYTRCAMCGKEMQVELMDLIKSGADLYCTSLFCGDDCGKKWRKVYALR